MIKPTEHVFRRFVLEHGGGIPSKFWSNLTKQEHAWLEKWSDKGFWDYGVSTRSGWITDKGRVEFEKSKVDAKGAVVESMKQ